MASIDPDVQASFWRIPGGFTSRSGGGFVSCPPYVIATVAADRVPAGAMNLPAGYYLNVLYRVKAITGWVGQDVFIDARQGAELAQIGRQILDADAIEPPLSYFERQSVEHLVRTVES